MNIGAVISRQNLFVVEEGGIMHTKKLWCELVRFPQKMIFIEETKILCGIFIYMQNFFDDKVIYKKVTNSLLYRQELKAHYQDQHNRYDLFCFHQGCKYIRWRAAYL